MSLDEYCIAVNCIFNPEQNMELGVIKISDTCSLNIGESSVKRGRGVPTSENVAHLWIAGARVKQEEPVSMQRESTLKTFLFLVV
jgi:hypothetical protein